MRAARSLPSLTIQGGLILARTESASSGRAGNLMLEVGKLVLMDGAQISSGSHGARPWRHSYGQGNGRCHRLRPGKWNFQ